MENYYIKLKGGILMLKPINNLINFISKLFGKNKPTEPTIFNHLPDEELLRYKQLEMEDEEESTTCTYVPNRTESPKTLSFADLLDGIPTKSNEFDNASVVDLLNNIFSEEDKPKFILLLKILKNMSYGNLEDVIYSTYDPDEVKKYLYEEPFENFCQTLVNLADGVVINDYGYILDEFIVEEFKNLVDEIFEVVLDEKEEVDFNSLKNLSDEILVPLLTKGTFPEED